jgi:DNA-binding transcriptional ArsR family regulator
MIDPQLQEEVMRLHAQVCGALADPTRILIIYSLSEGPRNVGDIAIKMDLAQPTVSRHLKILRDREIVRAERDGQTINYRLMDNRFIQALDLLRAALADQLENRAALVKEVKENLSL